MSGFEVEVLRTEDALRSAGADWRELYLRSEPRNPYLSHEWTMGCWGEVRHGRTPFVVTARVDGRLVGVAPLRLERRSGFRVLRFIGDGRSDYLGFLQSAEHPEVGQVLLDALTARRSEWDLAMLRQLGEPYTVLPRAPLPKALRARGVEGTVAPHFAHDGDWESALANGPGWLRRMPKESRRFERFGGTAERLVGAEAAAQVPTVAAIEAASWKGREGVARFQTPESQELLRSALLGLGAREEMELWLGRINGEPVAFEINFLSPGRIWLYQGAYCEEARKHSPGAVLDFRSIQRAWAAGAREYDFLAGDEEYKMERTTAQRPLHYLALFPATLRGQLAYSVLLALRWRLKQYALVRSAFQLWVHRKSALPALAGRLRRVAAAR